jgi:D-alanyl-D-alanine carboxypeptidase
MNFLTNKNIFLFFIILCFVFISSSTLSISKSVPLLRYNSTEESVIKSKLFPPLPVLVAKSYFPTLSAQGVVATDLDSGISLYEKNADAVLLPASTTKIITALVSLDTYQLDQVLTVGKGVSVDGQKMGLFTGEQMKFENLLYGLLVYSANDAAETLAQNYKGGYDAFVTAMNKKAADLSMTNTHFDNPVGLDTNGQHSTARDLVRASEVAMRNPEFAKVVGTKNIVVTDTAGKNSYNLLNVNELLGVIPGVVGVKTGWTENARENLVTYIERDNHDGVTHKVMIAVLGSQDRFGETKELINWIFGSYKWQEVKTP